MKVCFLCFGSSDQSGVGMNTYAWNIISRPRKNVEFIPFEHKRGGQLDWAIKEFILPVDQLRLMKIDADIYHAVAPFSTRIAIGAGKSPIITTVHDLLPNADVITTPIYYKVHTKKRRFLNPWYFSFLKKSDYFIASSNTYKQHLINMLHVDPEKVSVVYYGTDHQKFLPQTRKGYHNPKVILYIGALEIGKGIFDLVNAFGLIAKQLKDTKLLIGGRGPALPVLFDMVKRFGLEDSVHFLGFVPQEDLAHYYGLADIFVFPSYLGFHLMLLDAMATGLPVIAGSGLDAGEYVRDGGFLVKPGDVHCLAQTMANILSNEPLYVETSAKALKRASFFSWEKTAKETIDVYETFLSK